MSEVQIYALAALLAGLLALGIVAWKALRHWLDLCPRCACFEGEEDGP